jgi:hypothetical protein
MVEDYYKKRPVNYVAVVVLITVIFVGERNLKI